MKHRILMISLLVVMLMGMTTVYAQDAARPGTPEDNECNPGGVLYREENQDGCPTVWYWKAGWFLSRYNRGHISLADFPTEFESVLPSRVNSICSARMLDDNSWFACMSSDQTGYESINGVHTREMLFVYVGGDCPASAHNMPFKYAEATQSYMYDFYHFNESQIASIGNIGPTACIYYY